MKSTLSLSGKLKIFGVVFVVFFFFAILFLSFRVQKILVAEKIDRFAEIGQFSLYAVQPV